MLILWGLSIAFAFIVCQDNNVKRNMTTDFSDSIYSNYALFNHIKYSNIVKDISFEGISKSNLLIYRYSSESCDKCVEEDLQMLLDFQKKTETLSVLVVSSFPKNRNTDIRLRNELRNFNYRNIEEKEDMPVNKDTGLSMRFFIYYSEEPDAKYIFFPIKGRQDLTAAFFDLIYDAIQNI